MPQPVIGAVGAASVPLLQAALNDDPPKLSRPCIQIISDYVDRLNSTPEMRELLIPGVDGESIASADPEARLCGLKPEALERIAASPSTPARARPAGG